MKRNLIIILILAVTASAMTSILVLKASSVEKVSTPEVQQVNESKINWTDFQNGLELQKSSSKKMLVYVYTDWCSYCKKMESGTFSDPELIAFINKNYIPVKLNAESREVYKLGGYEFKYIQNQGRGYNELAAALLDGQMGYPSTVFMNEKTERITVYPGYQMPDAYKSALSYIAGDHYLSKTYDEFMSGN